MQFETETGSIYEVDTDNKRIKRVSNSNGRKATARQGEDQWRTYNDLSSIKIGESVAIVWNKATTPLLDGSPEQALPLTVTSQVTKIIE